MIGDVAGGIASFFEDSFGEGGGSPPFPPKLMHLATRCIRYLRLADSCRTSEGTKIRSDRILAGRTR